MLDVHAPRVIEDLHSKMLETGPSGLGSFHPSRPSASRLIGPCRYWKLHRHLKVSDSVLSRLPTRDPRTRNPRYAISEDDGPGVDARRLDQGECRQR